MLIKEFSELTGIYPDYLTYKAIEEIYRECNDNKQEFCNAYKENKDGLAEKIKDQVNWQLYHIQNEKTEKEERLEKENELLREKVEKYKILLDDELEWKEIEPDSYFSNKEYQEQLEVLNNFSKERDDDFYITLLSKEFGFDMRRIEILHTVPIFEKNRHNHCRIIAEEQRDPFYEATDFYYVRFSVAEIIYEAVDGDLYIR